ncbi:HlyD family secretion protein [Chitinophaga sp. RAB17]|uniref:HlyD family secretion protein n=1 Tax=Chitinophaga sp. RAB17 TaxID=3233049 RepID=UPI003F92BE70
MTDVAEDIELKSEELQSVLDRKPSWLLRFGISIIFVIVLLLVIIANLIRYPDVLRAGAMVTSVVPPIAVKSKVNGQVFFYVHNQDSVDMGAVLGYVRNATNMDDFHYVEQLMGRLLKLSTDDLQQQLLQIPIRSDLSLGEMEPEFLSFYRAVEQYRMFVRDNSREYETSFYLKADKSQGAIGRSLEKQRELVLQSLRDAERQYHTDEELFSRKIISKDELSNSLQNLVQKQLALESLNTNNEESLKNRNSINYNLSRIVSTTNLNKRELLLGLSASMNQLEVAMTTWKQKYLLVAPIPGEVNIVELWSDGQLVKEGQEVVKVTPHNAALFAKVYVPVTGSGKLEVGQRVNIRLDNFPYEEYGMLEGKVKYIPKVASNGMYEVTVSLNKGMTTIANLIIPYKPDMTGAAEVVTKEQSVAGRIFRMFNKVIRR